SVGFDGEPREFLAWALESDPPLATPAARLFESVGLPAPPSVRDGRRELAARQIDLQPRSGERDDGAAPRRRRPWRRRGRDDDAALAVRDAWIELGEGEERTEALRGAELRLEPGERVALMGRNGAGKSTLLRACVGLIELERGRVSAAAD